MEKKKPPERRLFRCNQSNYVLALRGVSLREHEGFFKDGASAHGDELFQPFETVARGNNVVNNAYLFSAQKLCVVLGQIKTLFPAGCD